MATGLNFDKTVYWCFLFSVSTLQEDCFNPFFSHSSSSPLPTSLLLPFPPSSSLVPVIHSCPFCCPASPQMMFYLVASSPTFEWNFFAKGLQNVKTEVPTSERQL